MIENKYSRWYLAICDSTKIRQTNEYVERHHVIPRSLGGKDTKDNLVSLTAREHYVAHLCLTRCTEGDDKLKMLCAVTCFKRGHHAIRMSGRLFARLREEHSAMLRERMSGANNPFYGKKHTTVSRAKIAAAQRGKPSKRLGYVEPVEVREKMRLAHLGVPLDEARKEKMRKHQRMQYPEARKKQSEKMKLFWADPVKKMEMLQKRTGGK